MTITFNFSPQSTLFQQAYTHMSVAENLAQQESCHYEPNGMSWLMIQGHDYFQRSHAFLDDVVLKLQSVNAQDAGHAHHDEYVLASQAMELGALFLMQPEAVDSRKELLGQLEQGLSTYHGSTFTYFKGFIEKFAAYVTRDIRMYEQAPVITEKNLNGMRILVEEHATYTLIRPKEDDDRSHLFVSIPHNGTQLPPEDLELRLKPASVVHSDSDLYLHEAWADVTAMGGTLMIAKIGRFAADLNRTRKDATGLTVEGREIRANARGRSETIWPATMSGDVLREGRMTEAAFEYRMSRYHDPYTQRRDRELANLKAIKGSAFFISAHNCPSEPGKEHEDYGYNKDKMRPAFNPGTTKGGVPLSVRHEARTLDGSIPQTFESKMTEAVMTLPPKMRKIVIEFFRQKALEYFPDLFKGLSGEERDFQACTLNDPYGGAGEASQMDYSPEKALPGFQLELIRKLLFHEVSEKQKGDLQKNENFFKLHIVIQQFLTQCWPRLEAMMEQDYGRAA